MNNSNTSPKKPSPLSFGSPRSSPFKRPESSLSRSGSAARGESPTPTASPRAQTSATEQHTPSFERRTPNRTNTSPFVANRSESPFHAAASLNTSPAAAGTNARGDVLAKIPPNNLRELRESFQVMDRDNDGQVTRQDVAEVLSQLGHDTSAQTLGTYLSTSGDTLSLPTYLHSIAASLSQLSPPDELKAAFSAFDLDDTGQIDIAELRDAVMNTEAENGRQLSAREAEQVMGDFSGRRMLTKGMGNLAGNRGEVFRYMDFLTSLEGGKAEDKAEPAT